MDVAGKAGLFQPCLSLVPKQLYFPEIVADILFSSVVSHKQLVLS